MIVVIAGKTVKGTVSINVAESTPPKENVAESTPPKENVAVV